MDEVIHDCGRIRANIHKINEQCYGPLDNKSVQNSTKLPFVLLLGNHSSGKSSFANYLMGRTVQSTGVAPTDDGFTVICSHQEDVDRTGSALVADPDLGFQSLSYFGPTLVNLTRLKYRRGLKNQDFMIVDTPGMIDSPASGSSSGVQMDTRQADISRGYDFAGVCQWLAERADLILLFFDPDKPGTTGETLNILTSSLAGYDYKLRIVLNKADQFSKIHDFARCYGSLCWNLSKVIKRKDLPPIYTMCVYPRNGSDSLRRSQNTNLTRSEDTGFVDKELPTASVVVQDADVLSAGVAETTGDQSAALAAAVQDLLATRDDVVAEVYATPRMRVDNEVARLQSDLESLLVHMKVLQNTFRRYSQYWWQWGAALCVSTAAQVGVGVALYNRAKAEFKYHVIGLGTLICGSLLGLGMLTKNTFCWYRAEALVTPAALDQTYERLLGSSGRLTTSSSSSLRIRGSNTSLTAIWGNQVLPHMLSSNLGEVMYSNKHQNPSDTSLSSHFVSELVTDSDICTLESLLEHNMTRIRKKANRVLVSRTGSRDGSAQSNVPIGGLRMNGEGVSEETYESDRDDMEQPAG